MRSFVAIFVGGVLSTGSFSNVFADVNFVSVKKVQSKVRATERRLGVLFRNLSVKSKSRAAKISAGLQVREDKRWFTAWNPSTGTVRSIWLPNSLPLPSGSGRVAMEEAAASFVWEHADLFGVRPQELVIIPGQTRTPDDGNLWTVDFMQVYKGVPVKNALISVHFKQKRLFHLDANTFPQISGAARLATNGLNAQATSGQVILPMPQPDGNYVFRPAERLRARKPSDPDPWVVYRDVTNSEVLEGFSLTRRAHSGEVVGLVHERSPLVEPVFRSLPGLDLSSNDTSFLTTTDSNGRFTLPPNENLAAFLLTMGGAGIQTWPCRSKRCSGRNIRLNDVSDERAQIVLVDAAPTQQSGSRLYRKTTPAERDVIFHLNRARSSVARFIKAPWITKPVVAMVNSSEGACNARYTERQLVFFSAGQVSGPGNAIVRCRNTGTVPGTIYHEWHHGLYDSLRTYEFAREDPAADEALADTFTFHMTDDSKIGVGFYEDRPANQNFVRDVGRSAPDGRPIFFKDGAPLTGDDYEDGAALSSALWELRRELIQKYGQEKGNLVSLGLFLKALTLKQTMSEFYEALLVADDDDADLLNGTPHKKEITNAFSSRCLATDVSANYCGANG